MDIEHIRDRVRKGSYVISFTHTEKLRRRKISLATIEQAMGEGEIIESYPEDPRGPSCLIQGYAKNGQPIHIVCGNLEKDLILIITAYEPDSAEWESDWKTRKKGMA